MQTQVRPRVANAPLSYGAFEITVGTDFQVPDPEDVLGAIGDAGYVGTDLGPPGYLGEGDTLQQRLADHRLDLVGGFVPVRFSEREHWDADLAGLTHTSRLFTAAGATDARPVLCDAGGPERIANPGRGGDERPPPRRPPLGARWSTASRVPPSTRARRATSPSSTITRRATSRACRRSSASSRTPRSTCCSTAATWPWPAATRSRA